VIGYALWALLLAGALVLEGLGLTHTGHLWPTVSDLFRSLTRPVLGRWIFFALWLWVGWHLFIRGWEFFLRGDGAQKPSESVAKTFRATSFQVVLPLLAVFVLFVLIGRSSHRLLASEDEAGITAAAHERAELEPARRPAAFLRYALVTLVVAYALFVAVIGGYQLAAGGSASGDFGSAIAYGAFLAFGVALPCFFAIALVSTVARRIRRRHRELGKNRERLS
jgi:TRAP-type C4-dicarboxylate transport system permease small subunit